MPEAAPTLPILRFGVYELDLRAGELRKQGIKIRLQEKPLEVLALLLEHPGEAVTRKEIRQRLWAADTFVDFDHGVNTAIKKLREALGDSAENPRFIETLPRHGYRFIGHVEPSGAQSVPAVMQETYPPPAKPVMDSIRARPQTSMGARLPNRVLLHIAGVLVMTLVLALAVEQNIGGLRGRLWPRSAAIPKIESIAVLPLENLSGDPAQEYFADGMTEELITDLGKISALRVISRTSVMHYRRSRKTLPEIARELNVDAIVEGTVRRSGNRVRITANLLYAPTDRHLWAQTYERELGDVLALQANVALAVAREVQIELTPQEQKRLARARPVNLEAYELYLKGRYEWNKRTKEGLNKGLEYFQQAVRVDPGYGSAYSGVADSFSILGNNGFLPGAEVHPKAKAAALKALELDGGLAEAHTSLAHVLFDYDRDYPAALREYQSAIGLDPNYATAHHWYAMSLAYIGRGEEALREIELARKLDPLSARINANIIAVLYLGRQYDWAIAEAHKKLELEPNNAIVHEYLGRVYLQKGMPREALAEFRKLLSLNRPSGVGPSLLARAYLLDGNREEALKILGTLKQLSKLEYVSPSDLATVYVSLGDRAEAFAWLEKGVAEYDAGVDRLMTDPAFDPLRSDPRFQDLLRCMNFPP